MAKPSNLVIVESPSKAKTIGKYLGAEYTVKASMGHLRDLPKSTMGVDLEHDFTPKYIPVSGKEELIRELKKAAAQAETVYLATDPDREGEAISWHLKELLKLPEERTFRVTFNEITQRWCRRPSPIPGASIMIWWMPSRPAGSWTGSWVMSCPRCCGRRSVVACLPAVSRVWLPGWWWTERMRSVPLFPKSTGRWM